MVLAISLQLIRLLAFNPTHCELYILNFEPRVEIDNTFHIAFAAICIVSSSVAVALFQPRVHSLLYML